MAITKRMLQKMAVKVIRDNPDALNPMSKEGCVYQNWSKTNTKRCIVGQIMHEFGQRIPRPGLVAGVEDVWEHYGWQLTPDGVRYLSSLQLVADNLSEYGVPWGEIKNVYEPMRNWSWV